MTEEKDYHEILGVPKTATEEEIREAYRNLSLKYHPDKHTDNPLSGLAEERFKDVLEAYQALIVPQQKAPDSGKAIAREGLILLGGISGCGNRIFVQYIHAAGNLYSIAGALEELGVLFLYSSIRALCPSAFFTLGDKEAGRKMKRYVR